MENYHMRTNRFNHEFIHRIPQELEEGVLYICLECNAVMHKCACGCSEEVSTPLGKNQWKLVYDGETVTLFPSIGNWNYTCRSHYLIRENNVIWLDEYEFKRANKEKKKRNWLRKLFYRDR